MADPQKLDALETYADTGDWGAAKARLGASQDQATGRQSALGSLIGAPAAATASTTQTAVAPYGRFLNALDSYQGQYEKSKANMASAQSDYMGQVAAAQAAHRAEADRTIAQSAANYYGSGGSGSGSDLSQWELKALAEARGGELQTQAQQEEAARAQQNQSEADQAAQMQGWAAVGDEDARSQRSIDYQLDKQGQATDDERRRAEQQWYSDHPEVAELNNIGGDQADAQRRQWEQERQQWVNDWAGSDRLGGSRSQRQEAYLNSLQPTEKIVLPNGELSLAPPSPGSTRGSEADQYVNVRANAAQDAIANQQMIADYAGPEFTRQGLVNLNLRPELGVTGQELLARGMFPDLTPKEQVDHAEALRQRDYFNQTGFSSPQDMRSWVEAQQQLDPNYVDPSQTKVLRADNPALLQSLGISDQDFQRITGSPDWESILRDAEDMVDPVTGDIPVQSIGEFRATLADLYDDKQMEDLVAAMYAPTFHG